MEQPAIEVQGLRVEYRRLLRRPVVAVRDLTLHVQRGETVGFVGPNGAGKSSTIKALMGFLYPTAGRVRVLGEPAGSPAAKSRLGYLPEVALYYPFMTASEVLELYGGLQGIAPRELKRKVGEVLDLVGLSGHARVLLQRLSKGMQQRVGIAQAIIGEPDLLILDELSSALDPIGRRDLRNLLRSLQRHGTTMFFSSHELSEVELLCDRVLIIDAGSLVYEGAVSDLLRPLNRYRIVYRADRLVPVDVPGEPVEVAPGWEGRLIRDEGDALRALRSLVEAGIEVREFAGAVPSLEDAFVEVLRHGPPPRLGGASPGAPAETRAPALVR